MALKSEKVEFFQLYGEGPLADLSRAVESFLNEGWTLETSSVQPLDSNQQRFRGYYALTRVVNVVPRVDLASVVSDSVMDAVKEGKVKKAEK